MNKKDKKEIDDAFARLAAVEDNLTRPIKLKKELGIRGSILPKPKKNRNKKRREG